MSISVVVPTFNRAQQLRRLLAAVSECTAREPFEVVVVDDGSSDDTPRVVAEFPDVRYVRQRNAGPAAARNAGAEVATKPIVAYIDDDCVPDKNWIAALEDAWSEADASVVGGIGGRIEPLADSLVSRFVQAEHLVDHESGDGGVRALVTANASFRRSVLRELGGFDTSFPGAAGEDTDLSFRLRDAGFRLAVSRAAVVLHDHRTGLRELLKTYRKHGAVRDVLLEGHPEEALGLSKRPGLAYWRDKWRYYRTMVGPLEACVFMVLRFLGLVNFVGGWLRRRLDTKRAR